MSATVLDGRAIAAEISAQVTRDVARFTAQRGPIKLCAVLVGADEAARLYAQKQRHTAVKVGVQYELLELPETITQSQLAVEVDRLNRDPAVTGIIMQLPLPPHIDPALAQYAIDPYKDVEGVNPANLGFIFYNVPIIAPCTALAVIELIGRSGLELRGAEAVVVGQSRIVGRPLSMFLTTRMATVTGCHIDTRDIAAHTRRADLVVVAVGHPALIGADHIRPGAVVIDVGINRVSTTAPDGTVTWKTVGDVDYAAVAPIAGAITPVPGGVGPVTVAMLLRNTVEAARKQRERDASS
ncbi:MAG: bifunctional 5,10-methylenetetrahydrofolate dehydrogenase/5,10-methenyltetrahydrofolate cyclohydrolase [Phycisphaerales bacterium]|nr:bifunctional 5,10-methylenetetrahydrofolate dehydrogenase/5,10-methenyltetrahydrofolate cyclohydrolase [Phycisphaerales bacterium]